MYWIFKFLLGAEGHHIRMKQVSSLQCTWVGRGSRSHSCHYCRRSMAHRQKEPVANQIPYWARLKFALFLNWWMVTFSILKLISCKDFFKKILKLVFYKFLCPLFFDLLYIFNLSKFSILKLNINKELYIKLAASIYCLDDCIEDIKREMENIPSDKINN